MHETADKQSSGYQQDQRERDLTYHQQSTKLVADDAQTTVALSVAAPGLQRGIQIDFDRPPCRRQAKKNSGDKRNAESKKQDSAADAYFIHARDIARLNRMNNV